MQEGDEGVWVTFIKQKVCKGWDSSQKPKRPMDYFCLAGDVTM